MFSTARLSPARGCLPALLTTFSLVAALLPAGQAQAHHSVTASFDMQHTVALDGTVRHVELASPHGEIVLENVDPQGHLQVWTLELLPGSRLRRMGWTDKSVVVGDHIRTSGAPSRYDDHRLYVQRLERADGTLLPLSMVSSESAKP